MPMARVQHSGNTIRNITILRYPMELDPALKPNRLDISETVRWLGYKPLYSLASLLSELVAYGDRGPPRFTEGG